MRTATASYSTNFGGGGGDSVERVAADDRGYVYVAGFTDSPNFPSYSQIYDYAGKADAFLLKVEPKGDKLVYGTFFGTPASDIATDVAVDEQRYVYLIGNTNAENFPTKNAFRTTNAGELDVFVLKVGEGGHIFLRE